MIDYQIPFMIERESGKRVRFPLVLCDNNNTITSIHYDFFCRVKSGADKDKIMAFRTKQDAELAAYCFDWEFLGGPL